MPKQPVSHPFQIPIIVTLSCMPFSVFCKVTQLLRTNGKWEEKSKEESILLAKKDLNSQKHKHA